MIATRRRTLHAARLLLLLSASPAAAALSVGCSDEVDQTPVETGCDPADFSTCCDPAPPDGDGDTMPDYCDACPFDPEPNQPGNLTRLPDDDEDGVPDRCDNCGPDICSHRGITWRYCENPYPAEFGPQADSDGDGIGDKCDSCPTVPNRSDNLQRVPYSSTDPQADDPDGDHVGRACDTCDEPNSWKACLTDAECTLVRTDGSTVPGECLELGTYGRCDDDEGRICAPQHANKDCQEFVSCEYAINLSYGRCNQVLDDPDGNGLGGPCAP